MLELRDLRHVVQGRDVLTVAALTLEPGARLAVVGSNGAGKSTLLRILALIDEPTAGTITLDGRSVAGGRARRAARRRVTLVEQRPFLFHGPVLDNVMYGLRCRGVARHESARRARTALADVEAGALAARDARALSEGEVQRVAVARALALAPDILLLDEPVSAADRGAQRALYSAISAAQEGRPLSVGVATHQLEDAYQWADRILALHEGLVSPVTPENLFRVRLPGGAALQHVQLGPLGVDVPTDRTGPATLAIPPDEIVLSTEPLHSSARNHVAGRVVRVAAHGAAVRVTVDGGGIELVALITQRSFEELGLAVGGPVHAAFKSVAVRVF